MLIIDAFALHSQAPRHGAIVSLFDATLLLLLRCVTNSARYIRSLCHASRSMLLLPYADAAAFAMLMLF